MKGILKKHTGVLIAGLMLAILLVFVIGSAIGYASLSFDRLLPVWLGQGTTKEHLILFNIRLPRMTMSLLAGMALAMSGAIMQSITRNELAEPGLLGINSGAGVAVALFYLWAPVTQSYTYQFPLVAFGGALLTAVLIYLFSYRKQFQPLKLVLTGVGMSMALSGLMIVLISSADREKVNFISKWLAGNIWGADWPYIIALLPWLVVIIPILFLSMSKLNLLQLNDETTISIGLRLNMVRILLLLAAVAIAAAAVSVTGGISFVGLMAPHLARALAGPRAQAYLPVSLLLGGLLLLIADLIGKNILYPDGLPAGVVVALIGAPYFIILMMRSSSR